MLSSRRNSRACTRTIKHAACAARASGSWTPNGDTKQTNRRTDKDLQELEHDTNKPDNVNQTIELIHLPQTIGLIYLLSNKTCSSITFFKSTQVSNIILVLNTGHTKSHFNSSFKSTTKNNSETIRMTILNHQNERLPCAVHINLKCLPTEKLTNLKCLLTEKLVVQCNLF